ncbi:carbamoyl phosphate synthase small subunit [Bacillus sp. FJAT-49732]|uniref:carbamoyl-phosphate synthase (glutamine-hydrolyzing) n=1 Tax=Lederbergia citrisecunda TaxID=2833583 RepID=A0A942YJ89_9BACI|nr:carbamoyl phosphate synthase small subunit [Lederbergia citrisecunda]MBS4199098.1 carbamoyl phosphate synthase small subunit [Lederbergia citrisecunda]
MMEGMIKLANGVTYTGHWHGDETECSGEMVFFTGMGNFLEFISDPAMKGKIVLATYPSILNSFIDQEKLESEDIQVAGLVIQQEYGKSSLSVKKWLTIFKEKCIPVMTGMDTRSIIKQLLKVGETPVFMKANEVDGKSTVKRSKVMSSFSYQTINPNGKSHIALIDFSVKKSLMKWLIQSDYKVTIVPAEITAEKMKALNPDGIVFSGGAGNPSNWKKYFPEYKEIAKEYPTMAFGLGHQILAEAFGAYIEKMKWGHRSFKHPIMHVESKEVYMSNQNHGYEVSEEGLEDAGFNISFQSIQDQSIEGLTHKMYPIATYQFHPDGKNPKLETIIKYAFSNQLRQAKGENIYA